MYFGASSPNTMCRNVIPAKASVTETDVTTACGVNSAQGKERLQQVCQKLFPYPAERETGQGDAELSRRQIGVEMTAHVLNDLGAGVSLIDQGIQLAAPDFDDRKLATNEKAVEDHQSCDHEELAEQDAGSVPVIGDRIGKRRRGQMKDTT